MGGFFCIIFAMLLVLGAFTQYGCNQDESGSILMVAASICLLAAVISWKSMKPESPEPKKLSQEPEGSFDKDLFDDED